MSNYTYRDAPEQNDPPHSPPVERSIDVAPIDIDVHVQDGEETVKFTLTHVAPFNPDDWTPRTSTGVLLYSGGLPPSDGRGAVSTKHLVRETAQGWFRQGYIEASSGAGIIFIPMTRVTKIVMTPRQPQVVSWRESYYLDRK